VSDPLQSSHEKLPRQDNSGKPPHLDPYERVKARQEESLNAKVTYEVVRNEGENELGRSSRALLWSGLAAGLSMGFSFLTEGILRDHLPDTPWRPLITKMGYPVGFLIITLANHELFTEHTVSAVVPTLTRKTGAAVRNLLRLWSCVLAGNLVGAFVFALVLGTTTIVEASVHQTLSDIGRETLRWGLATMFVRAIFAGWLIALMVWMLPAASQLGVVVVFVMTYIVGIAGLSHIIAGSTETLYLVVRGEASLPAYVGNFFIPTLIGNSLGGILLVTAINHAQVVSGED
jgi:formate/nitrite transporter FocA (FNT family)